MLVTFKNFFYLLLSLPLLSLAADEHFQQDKDYRLVANPMSIEREVQQIEVTEFFSYGCPACYKIEPAIQTWLKHRPQNVAFSRVPVIFQRGWEVYAKAYYIAEAFGVEAKLTPRLFEAVQTQNLNLTDKSNLTKFFVEAGLSAADFASAFDNSPAIAIKLKQDDEMTKYYNMLEIPTFIINNQYYTSAAMAKNPERLVQIINFLIAKAKAD